MESEEKIMNSQLDTCQIIHIPEKEPYPLHQQPTENVLASVVDPKHANAIVRRLNQIVPVENLLHVKRIQMKILEGGLQICCNIKRRVARAMQVLANIISSKDLVVNGAVIVDPLAKQVISSARDEVFAWNMCKDNNSLLTVHPCSNRRGPNEPQLVNSSSNQLKQSYTGVACLHPWQWTQQQSHVENSYYWHPLRHAAIVAIESSAARDRHLFPPFVENIEEKSLELDASSPAKRQRTVCENVGDDEKQNVHSQAFQQASVRPYLCTGYDIYLVWEPCTMCATALVHQRIRRIFYAFPNLNAGSLGSVHRLQGEKSLNHHYAVFRVLLPEEVLHKCSAEITETLGENC